MSDNITLSDDDEEFTREDVTTLLLEVMDWVYAKAHRNRPMTEAEQKVLNDIRTALAAEPKQEPVAKAWAEGYQQGVKDERTSEASIGIAGFGAKVEPARQNPYGTALAAEQQKPEPVAYFDLQKQVFFWAKPTQIDVPMTIALEPLPLYAAPPEDEALRRDAERYRWLQDAGQKYWMEFADMTAEATEAAIDAAMEGKR